MRRTTAPIVSSLPPLATIPSSGRMICETGVLWLAPRSERARARKRARASEGERGRARARERARARARRSGDSRRRAAAASLLSDLFQISISRPLEITAPRAAAARTSRAPSAVPPASRRPRANRRRERKTRACDELSLIAKKKKVRSPCHLPHSCA